MWVVGLVLAIEAWILIVFYACLSEYPAACHEPNDYGEKHRTS